MQNLVLVVQNSVAFSEMGAGSALVAFFRSLGTGVGEIFLVAAPMGVIAFLAILFLEEVPLGTVSGVEAAARESEAGATAAPAAIAETARYDEDAAEADRAPVRAGR